MERSIFGFFTALLCAVCLVAGTHAFRKKRFGLATLLWLNAFTNLVNSIHAFYMTLFQIEKSFRTEGNHAYKQEK